MTNLGDPGANKLALEEDCVVVKLAFLERAKLLIVSPVMAASPAC
jgi:hypothetical protein